MADFWIRVHANLAAKPVVWRAVEALGITKHEAMGLLTQFWGAVSQHAENGRIRDVPDSQLEEWAGWTKKRGKFAAFVRSKHMDADGRVNEWDEYAGALEHRREKERSRKQDWRDRSRVSSDGSPWDSPGDSPRDRDADSPNDVPGDVPGTETGTVRPTRAKRNETKRNEKDLGSSESVSPSGAGSSSANSATAPRRSFAAFATFADLPPELIAFGARFYGHASAERRRDVAQQLLDLANGHLVDYKGAAIRAGSIDRLIAACRAVRIVKDADKAIAVLLRKLGDTSDLSPMQVAKDVADREHDERETAEELERAEAWYRDADVSVGLEIERQLVERGFPPNAGDAFASVCRSFARNGLVLARWRDAGCPEVAHA